MHKVTSIVLNNFKNDSRVLKENISLKNAGYDVSVVALWEDGVREKEVVQGVPVHRIKLKTKNWSKNKLVQIIKYFELVYKVQKAYKDSDIFHCNDLNTLPIGVMIKLFFNKNSKIVYDAHEHESYRAGYSERMQKITQWIEGKLIKYVDKIITVSDPIAEDYKLLYQIEKPRLVLNTPLYIERNKQDIFRKKFDISSEKIIFLYQGGLSSKRGILEFAEIVRNMKEVVYVVMGYGTLEKEIKKIAQESENIFFHEAVSPEVLLNYTSSADIGVCIEENICKSWDYALPNKLFEYLLAGLPVLVGGLSEMRNFVEKYEIGYTIDNINDIKKIIYKVKDEYKIKLANVDKISKKFNWQEQEKVLLKVYKELED